ncbi:hypothetical protein PR003_g15763 [Phytophthora rubi]|uniref:leucine--tRNA ligase n=1 Tax=Phytophthora rubi TaxID=129364 RepID=A0A6A3JN67_9STRA|nr:hypothetical protein PR001_g20278 [Phytophthora rubi]KAE9328551.1 hypothetical protein PR003_g15763 [Phytophthora rubi]
MFSYPSGKLHIGHVRVYIISDCMARLKRIQGYDVLHHMAWDAFGLPAENAGISPAEWSVLNIAQAKRQFQALGTKREVTTRAPGYYKWIFLQKHTALRVFDALELRPLFSKGLAYRKEAPVNWDPVDVTVLANEQMDAEGRSWRSGAVVEQRSLNQWFLCMIEYGDRLLDDLNKLSMWSDAVKLMQASWTGSQVKFQAVLETAGAKPIPLTMFTTRVDTFFGVILVSMAPW